MNDWDDLKLFLAVARSGTLTSAADDLNTSVSTLHRRLKSFELSMGSPLFEKSPRGYVLSNIGETLLPLAEEVEEAVSAASRSVTGHDQNASGEVRITLPLVLLRIFAPHLASFSKVCSRICPIVLADDTSLNLDREVDIAFRATLAPDRNAIGHKICDLAWGRYVSSQVTTDEPRWIHYREMDGSPAIQWRKRTFPKSEPMLIVHGVVGMHSVLAKSEGQGLLPCFVGDQDPELRRIGTPVAHNQLWVLRHENLRRSARVRAMLDFLVPRILSEKERLEGRLEPITGEVQSSVV